MDCSFPNFPTNSKARYLKWAIEDRLEAHHNLALAHKYRSLGKMVDMFVQRARACKRGYWKNLKAYDDIRFSNLHPAWDTNDAA